MWALSYWVTGAIVAQVGGRSSYRASDVDSAYTALVGVLRRLDPDTMVARTV